MSEEKETEGQVELTPEEQAKKDDIMARIEHTLNKIRPYIQAEGGDVVLLDYDAGIATVEMVGACAGCMMASTDISEGVEALVVDEIPEVMKVVLAGTPVTPYYY